ncbi:amidohydrolase family protein [Candidatus Palauibacter sp.]|uniref:amidohydrolase family protein n=1 Tax=Candidatus Palauibacter sp. TaxID=3101350 RepID=UPI003CC53E77
MTIDSGVGRDRRTEGGRRTAWGLVTAWLVTLAFAACASPESGEEAVGAGEVADLVILGGRVMDPETRLDAMRDVAVSDGRITAVAEGGVAGRDTIDASGLVVAPGFVDLHAHGQDTVSAKLQALDGVTTALEMEIGVYPMAEWVASREGTAPIHFGATVSHPGARVKLITGVDVGHSTMTPPGEASAFESEAVYGALDDDQLLELNGLMASGLQEGGLGIGFGITYTPGASRTEIYRAFQLAAAQGAPAYVHIRGENSGGTLGAFQEVIANALATGASLHIVHMNSSADEMARTTLEMIRGARERGIDITTESYPYTAGSTRIESALFDSWEGLSDEEYSRLQWSGTPERLNAESFRRYREQGGWVVIHGRNEETNEWIVAQPDVIVASDGIPYLYAAIHPRGAGTYSRVLGHYVRERGALSLMDALAKMTILPAQRVEGFAPVMARKGRVQVGADADLTVFDPETIIDRSTYADPAAPSEGVMYVLVEGTAVVRDGEIVPGVYPGQPITSGTR